jgi:uncharacterized membrane protein YphA (DoxX/SURF4 family)
METHMRICNGPMPIDAHDGGKAMSQAASAFSRRRKLYAAVPVTLRVGLGALFVWSGSAKLLAPQHFAAIVDAFGFIPEAMVFPTALALCGLEIAAGLGLILHRTWALGLVTGLLMLFTAVLIYGLWLGLDVDCGCFGPQDPEAKAYHGMRQALYRDFAMLVVAGYLFYQKAQKNPKSGSSPPSPIPK